MSIGPLIGAVPHADDDNSHNRSQKLHYHDDRLTASHMRIAVLAPSSILESGVLELGPPRTIRSLCAALGRLPDTEVTAFAIRLTPCETTLREQEGLRLAQCWAGDAGGLLKAYSPDILQTFSSTATNAVGLWVGKTARRLGAAWVDTVLGLVKMESRYGYRHTPQSVIFEQMRLAAADCVVVPSQFALRAVRENYGQATCTATKLIPLGVDEPWLDAGSWADREDAHKSDMEIVSVGGIASHKGQDILLRAFGEAGVQGRVRFIGPEIDPRYAQKLRDTAKTLQPSKRVEFMGFLSQSATIEAVRSANVFALLSRFDVFPIAVVEAMALHHAPIVTRTSGTADLIENGKSGYLLGHGESDAASGVLDSIAQKFESHIERGHRARVAAETCRWPLVALQYASLYRELT